MSTANKNDMENAVLDLARKDGITDIRQLDVVLAVRRRDYYGVSIKAYNEGRVHGVASANQGFRAELRRAFLGGLLIGAIGGLLIATAALAYR